MVLTVPSERPIFLREYENGTYSVLSYYMAKTVADIPFYIFFPTVTVTIAYWLVGLRATAKAFFIFLADVILLSNIAQSIGTHSTQLFCQLLWANLLRRGFQKSQASSSACPPRSSIHSTPPSPFLANTHIHTKKFSCIVPCGCASTDARWGPLPQH